MPAALFFIPALNAASMLYPDNQRRHRASRFVESAKLMIHFSASWPVRSVIPWPSKYAVREGQSIKSRGIYVELCHIAFQSQ